MTSPLDMYVPNDIMLGDGAPEAVMPLGRGIDGKLFAGSPLSPEHKLRLWAQMTALLLQNGKVSFVVTTVIREWLYEQTKDTIAE